MIPRHVMLCSHKTENSMELPDDSEVWNVPLMTGWPPALGLESVNLAGCGFLWQFFKIG